LKILVLSDSHRTMQYMMDAIDIEHPDYVIHLGDHVGDADALSQHYPLLPVLSVKGNCDFEPNGRELALTEYGGIRIMAAHGHRYGVKSGLLRYVLAAKENQADVALFGHTHHAMCEKYEEIWLLNPGSCGYCSQPTYGLVEIHNHSVSCSIHKINDGR